MGALRTNIGHMGLRAKIVILCISLVAVFMAADILWNSYVQNRQAEQDAYEKATTLATQMDAVWEFVDINQATFDSVDESTGTTRGLVCVIAAKSVAKLFTANSEDYIIRYTDTETRVASDAADDYELAALEAFREDPTLTSYYGFSYDDEGNEVYRYVEPLRVTDSCLECHGDPVGELDSYGYPKEGLKIGDLAGAMSITEPVTLYREGRRDSIVQQVCMMLIALALTVSAIYLAVRYLILRPVEEIGKGTDHISDGDLSYRINAHGGDEMAKLADSFDDMATQLEELYEDLEGQVNLRTEQLTEANEALERQSLELKEAYEQLHDQYDFKADFFAMMSHELRTPLTSILAYADMLEGISSQDGNATGKKDNAIREIKINGNLLLSMVNNILVLTRADANRLELTLEPVELIDLVALVRDSLTPLATIKQQKLSMRIDGDVPLIMADWEKLRRILENLVSNAIKYTHTGGTIGVHVSYDDVHDTVVFAVTDDGIGMKPDEVERVFERYKQAGQSSNRRYKGSGLGLTVVRELAELHGGSVSVETRYKMGSTFTVVIPARHVEYEDTDEDTPDR